MAKEKQAEAQENLPLEVSGSDQAENSPEFDSAFDLAVDGKDKSVTVEVEKESSSKEKVAEKTDEKTPAASEKEDKTDDQKPKTAMERAEELAKSLPAEDANGQQATPPPVDVFNQLPPEYAWAKNAVASGKIDEFLKSQPKAIGKLLKSADVDDVQYVMDLYAKSQQKTAEPTKQEVKALMEQYGNVSFKAPDGTQKTLSAIAEEYGNTEVFEAIAALNRAMLEGNSKGADNSQNFSELQSELATMKANQAFWEDVLEVHPDARKLMKSGKLEEWVKTKATDGIKRLYRSPNTEHAILVLDAMKESLAAESKSEADKKAGEKKKLIDGLHGESLRPKRENKTSTSSAEKESPSDFDEGFEAALRK
jgi:hypothetical protein